MLPANLGFQRRILEREVTRKDLPDLARRRAVFLLLWDAGASLGELAKHAGISTRAVRKWQAKFVELQGRDLAASMTFIQEIPRRGRPRVRHAEIIAAIGALTKKGEISPGAKLGSVRLAKKIPFSERTIRAVLAKLRPRRRAPAETPAAPTPPPDGS